MFMILKRKQMIVTALVFMLGIAGYLNYRYDKEETLLANTTDLEEPDIGESVMVSGENAVEKSKESSSPKKTEDPFARENYRNLYEQIENQGIDVVLGSGYGAVKNYATIDNAVERGYTVVRTREDLEKLLSDETISQEVRTNAEQRLNDIIFFQENETAAENMLSSKGYPHTFVYMTSDSVNVTVKDNAISKSDTARIVDVIYELTQNNNIKIVEVN